jgi:hypothetical protein
MKTKLFIALFIVGSFAVIISCKKEKKEDNSAQVLTKDQLNDVSENTQQLFTNIEGFMFNSLSKALEAGYAGEMPPQSASSAKAEMSEFLKFKNAKGDGDWFGPDADGWYIRSWEGIYKYTEKVRCKDTVLTSIYIIEYSGGDGSYSNVWENQYVKYKDKVSKKVLYKGYSDWKISSFGDNDISDVQWRFEFEDWNPETGAGVYDWYWGAQSLGGGYEPYHRILNIIATEKGIGIFNTDDYLLHVKITWYDGNEELWEYEYDTEWSPVEMPEMPCKSDGNIIGIN